MAQICTDCAERCIITPKDKDCAKVGDRVWLHREEVICRSCLNASDSCYHCVREPDKDHIGKFGLDAGKDYEKISEYIYNLFLTTKK